MKTLHMYRQTDNKDCYMAVFDKEEALNLAYKGTREEAAQKALEIWGLNEQDVNIEYGKELEPLN